MQCTTVNYQQLCEPGPWPVCVCVCVFALSALPSKHLFPKNHDRQAEALTINKREQNTKKWKEKKISKRKYTEQKVGSSHVSPYLDLYRVVLYWSAKPIKKKNVLVSNKFCADTGFSAWLMGWLDELLDSYQQLSYRLTHQVCVYILCICREIYIYKYTCLF